MRYNLMSPRAKKDGGTFWHRIGTAFPRDKGGFSLMLDSLPIADKEGRVMVLMVEQDDNPQQRQDTGTRPASRDLEDDIPFAPEWRG